MSGQFVVAAFVSLAACAAPEPHSTVGRANPASKYCAQIGGRVEIRKETDGEVGYCHLPDGRVIEEWTLFHDSQEDAQVPIGMFFQSLKVNVMKLGSHL